jgi:thioredoxin 1
MSKILNINADHFEAEVMKSNTPVLVDFWAPWCGPCQMMGPVLDEVSKEIGLDAKVVKVDVNNEANIALARQFRIMSIPSIKVFKGGKVVEEFVGMQSKAELIKTLRNHL